VNNVQIKDSMLHWYEYGACMSCSHVIVVYDKGIMGEAPILVFVDQDINKEVVKFINDDNLTIIAILALSDEAEKQMYMEYIPANRLVSRMEN